MRKILLTIIVASLFVIPSQAQIKKGSLFLGGDIGGSTLKTESNGVTVTKQRGVNATPVFGKVIRENLVLGFNLGLNIYAEDAEPSGIEYDIKTYDAGIFLRKYERIAKSDFYLFLQGGFGASYFNQEQKSTFTVTDEVKRLTFALSVYPGISYAVNKKLHLETGLNNILAFNYINEKRTTGNPVTAYKTNAFALSSSLNNASSIRIGFRVLIGR